MSARHDLPLLPGIAEAAPVVDLLDVDTCQAKWRVELGEVFVLRGQHGPHVLVCGDARDRAVAEVVDDAVQHDGVSQVITDPPYGFGYVQGAEEEGRLSDTGKALAPRRKDRELDGGDEFDPSFMPVWRDIFVPESVYLFTRWTEMWRWRLAMVMNGWPPQSCLIWDKMHYGMGDVSRYGDQLEDILVWYERGKAPNWTKREGNLWTEPRGVCLEGGQVGHPTPKPFGLYRRAMQHGTRPGDVVVDMFAGSGPALIVGDGLRRRVGAADLSPRYCALALERCARYGIEVIHRSKDTRIECLPSPSDPTS